MALRRARVPTYHTWQDNQPLGGTDRLSATRRPRLAVTPHVTLTVSHTDSLRARQLAPLTAPKLRALPKDEWCEVESSSANSTTPAVCWVAQRGHPFAVRLHLGCSQLEVAIRRPQREAVHAPLGHLLEIDRRAHALHLPKRRLTRRRARPRSCDTRASTSPARAQTSAWTTSAPALRR